MGRIVSVRVRPLSPTLGIGSDNLWWARATGRGQPADLAPVEGVARVLLFQRDMILTTLLTVLFVGISSLMLWLAIGAD